MARFYKHVAEHQNLIIAVYLLLLIFCAACKPFVAVNYDMNDYLPPDSASTRALELMEQEYDGGIPNARVMVYGVSVPEALEYKAKLLSTDGVTDVTWLDDAASVTVPLEALDADTVESYYKDGNALFSVTIAEDDIISAVNDISDLIGDDNAMEGSAVSTATATQSTAMQRLLEKGIEITAVYAISDVMAIGAIRAILDKGLKVPDDISITGFDGSTLAQYYNPKIVSIRQPHKDMAARTC